MASKKPKPHSPHPPVAPVLGSTNPLSVTEPALSSAASSVTPRRNTPIIPPPRRNTPVIPLPAPTTPETKPRSTSTKRKKMNVSPNADSDFNDNTAAASSSPGSTNPHPPAPKRARRQTIAAPISPSPAPGTKKGRRVSSAVMGHLGAGPPVMRASKNESQEEQEAEAEHGMRGPAMTASSLGTGASTTTSTGTSPSSRPGPASSQIRSQAAEDVNGRSQGQARKSVTANTASHAPKSTSSTPTTTTRRPASAASDSFPNATPAPATAPSRTFWSTSTATARQSGSTTSPAAAPALRSSPSTKTHVSGHAAVPTEGPQDRRDRVPSASRSITPSSRSILRQHGSATSSATSTPIVTPSPAPRSTSTLKTRGPSIATSPTGESRKQGGRGQPASGASSTGNAREQGERQRRRPADTTSASASRTSAGAIASSGKKPDHRSSASTLPKDEDMRDGEEDEDEEKQPAPPRASASQTKRARGTTSRTTHADSRAVVSKQKENTLAPAPVPIPRLKVKLTRTANHDTDASTSKKRSRADSAVSRSRDAEMKEGQIQPATSGAAPPSTPRIKKKRRNSMGMSIYDDIEMQEEHDEEQPDSEPRSASKHKIRLLIGSESAAGKSSSRRASVTSRSGEAEMRQEREKPMVASTSAFKAGIGGIRGRKDSVISRPANLETKDGQDQATATLASAPGAGSSKTRGRTGSLTLLTQNSASRDGRGQPAPPHVPRPTPDSNRDQQARGSANLVSKDMEMQDSRSKQANASASTASPSLPRTTPNPNANRSVSTSTPGNGYFSIKRDEPLCAAYWSDHTSPLSTSSRGSPPASSPTPAARKTSAKSSRTVSHAPTDKEMQDEEPEHDAASGLDPEQAARLRQWMQEDEEEVEATRNGDLAEQFGSMDLVAPSPPPSQVEGGDEDSQHSQTLSPENRREASRPEGARREVEEIEDVDAAAAAADDDAPSPETVDGLYAQSMSHHTGRRPPRRGEGRPQENDDPNRNLRSHRNSGRARAGRRDGGESQPTPGREAIREETQGVHADLTLRQYQQYRYYHDLERAANAAVSQAAVAAHEDPAPEEEEQDAAHGDGYEAEAPLNAPPPSTTAYDVLYEENFNMFAQLDAERCECNKHPYPHVPETGICDNTPMVRIHGRPAAVWRNRQAWLRWLELHPFLMDEYLDALDEYERLYSEEDGDGDEDEDEDEDSEEEREEEDEDQYRPVNERARLLL